MRIVYIAHNDIPGTSAAGVHVMRMAQAIGREGHDVTLLATVSADASIRAVPPHGYYGTEDNFRVVTIEHTRIANVGRLMFALKCLRRLRKSSPDLVYSREIISCALAAVTGYNTVFEMHHPIHRESRFKRWLLDRLANSSRVSCLVTISSALADVVRREVAIPGEKLVVAHDGADEPPAETPLAHLADSAGRCNVGYVGSLHAGKGMELIADAVPHVRGALIHVIGGTPAQIEYWRSRAPSDNLRFYGRVRPGDVASFIKALDVCLLPNQPVVRSKGGNDIADYTSPLKMFEYMAAGKAIICSDLPVLREVLDRTTAVLLDATDPLAWAATIDELARDEDRRLQLGRAALARFRAEHTWSVRARNVLSRAMTSELRTRAGVCHQ